MIRWLFVALLVLAVVVAIGFLMVRDTGYVLVMYDNTSIETSLWVGVVLVSLSALAFYVILRVGFGLLRTQRKYRKWRQRQQELHFLQQTNTSNGVEIDSETLETAEILKRIPPSKHQSLLSIVQDAQVNHVHGDYKARDKLFERAVKHYPKASDDLALRHLALELSQGFTKARLAKIEEMLASRPKHLATQTLYFETCVNWGLYDRVKTILPKLRKRGRISAEKLDKVELEIWRSAINESNASSIGELRKLLPKKLRQNVELVIHFVGKLRSKGEHDNALDVVEHEISDYWDVRLVELYGLFRVDPERQLRNAKLWLREHSDDPTLLLTLGRLSAHNNQLDLAREYYEKAVRENPSREVHVEFADLCLRLGNRELHDSHQRRAEQLLLTETLKSSHLPVAL